LKAHISNFVQNWLSATYFVQRSFKAALHDMLISSLDFGIGGTNGSPDTLYFTDGIGDPIPAFGRCPGLSR
jgi:hypothetical protein